MPAEGQAEQAGPSYELVAPSPFTIGAQELSHINQVGSPPPKMNSCFLRIRSSAQHFWPLTRAEKGLWRTGVQQADPLLPRWTLSNVESLETLQTPVQLLFGCCGCQGQRRQAAEQVSLRSDSQYSLSMP